MLGTRHEEYNKNTDGLPFVLNIGLERNHFFQSKENNWHENIEIQLCTAGHGWVLLDGRRYTFSENDIIVVNSNVLHYTSTDTELTYDCLIISTELCDQVGINPNRIFFTPFINNTVIVELFSQLKTAFSDHSDICRSAKLHKLTLEILIELTEYHSLPKSEFISENKKFETVKKVVSYIRNNYQKKITLDDISKNVLCDKYTLCKEFKKLTGQTIIENLNSFRCIKAVDYLSAGYSVSDTAALCGFENLSFFTKTFKKYIGSIPSKYKK